MDTKLKLRLLKLLFKPSKYPINSNQKTEAGFNLLDVAIVVIIVGILSAIAAPAWDAFVQRQRFRAAQNTVFQAMQSAQSAARGSSSSWQISFMTDEDDDGNDRVYVALHSANVVPDDLGEVGEASGITENAWYPLAEGIQIYAEEPDYTKNLIIVSRDGNDPNVVMPGYDRDDIHGIIFNYSGCPIINDGEECTESLGDLTPPMVLSLAHERLGDARRCVIVETIIGSMRTDEDDNCNRT